MFITTTDGIVNPLFHGPLLNVFSLFLSNSQVTFYLLMGSSSRATTSSWMRVHLPVNQTPSRRASKGILCSSPVRLDCNFCAILCLSVCVSVCMSVCPCICRSQSVLPIYLLAYIYSIYIPVCISLGFLSVNMSVCQSI